MTIETCKNETAYLGFSRTVSGFDEICDDAFLPALRRALAEIDTALPRERYLLIEHTGEGEGAFTRYDLTESDSAFLRLTAPPAVFDGEKYIALSEGYLTEGAVLLLPRSAPGTYRVSYRQKPMQPTEETDPDTEIPLAADTAPLLPLLVAYYLLLDDNLTLAREYLERYREGMARILAAGRGPRPAECVSTNGW